MRGRLGVLRHGWLVPAALALLAWVMPFAPLPPAQAADAATQTPPTRVVVINSWHKGMPWQAGFEKPSSSLLKHSERPPASGFEAGGLLSVLHFFDNSFFILSDHCYNRRSLSRRSVYGSV